MNKEQVEAYIQKNPFEQLGNIVFNILVEEITSLNLMPGNKLNISKISEELDVSRTPVREALIKLEEGGFVEKISDKQGFYVRGFESADIEQLYFARSTIESKTAYLCAQFKKCPNIEKLMELAEGYYTASVSDFEIMAEMDRQFHRLIINASSNKYLIQMYELIETKIKLYKKLNFYYLVQNNLTNDIEKVCAEHNAIVNSIRLNMPEYAEKEMLNHINSSFRELIYANTAFKISRPK